MNSDLQTQTDLLLKALNQMHNDLTNLNLTAMTVGVVVTALLLVIAFRRR